jgi:uncharacterized membrane protein
LEHLGSKPKLAMAFLFKNNSRFLRIGRLVTGFFFIAAGLNHFRDPDFYVKMIPPFLPEPSLLNILSGLAEIALGLGLFFEKSVNYSVYGLIALLIAVFPANIQMLYDALQQPEPQFPVWALVLRLPIQGLMILWVYSLGKEKI